MSLLARGSRFQSCSERDSMLLCPSRGKRVPYPRSTMRNIGRTHQTGSRSVSVNARRVMRVK